MKFIYLFLYFCIMMAFIGSHWSQEGLDKYTFMNTSWNSTNFEVQPNSEGFASEYFSQNLVTKTMDWIGYSAYEIGKAFFSYGYDHPEYDFKWYAWAFIIIGLLSALIPIIYLVSLLGFGIFYFVIWIKKKRIRSD